MHRIWQWWRRREPEPDKQGDRFVADGHIPFEPFDGAGQLVEASRDERLRCSRAQDFEGRSIAHRFNHGTNPITSIGGRPVRRFRGLFQWLPLKGKQQRPAKSQHKYGLTLYGMQYINHLFDDAERIRT